MKKKLLILLLALFEGSVAHAAIGKVLVVLSSQDHIKLKDGRQHPTGYYFSELVIPAQVLIDHGFELVFASPQGSGSRPVMDQSSFDKKWFGSDRKFQGGKETLKHLGHKFNFDNPRKISSLSDKELSSFSGIFLPGGHAPMNDLYRNQELGRILRHFNEHKKPTALICHAPIALLSSFEKSNWPYKGYEMTAFSDKEEKEIEDLGWLSGGKVEFYIASKLSSAGARVSVGEPWKSHIVRDKELITGQNPMSDHRFSEGFLAALQNYIKNKVLNIIQSRQIQPWKRDVKSDVLYNASTKKLSGEDGYLTLFVGRRKRSFSKAKFLKSLSDHIFNVQKNFSAYGLRGYYIVATTEYEIALQSWSSRELAFKAFKNEKHVVEEASRMMKTTLFQELKASEIPDNVSSINGAR